MSELTEKINDEITKFQDIGEREVAMWLNIFKKDIEKYDLQSNPELNFNQQFVLEFLKKEYKIGADPIACIFSVHNELLNDEFSDISESYYELECIEELEVIQAFSAWVREQEGEGND